MTPKKKTRFLERLAAGASVSAACVAIDLSRTAVYNARAGDSEFAAKWEESLEQGTEKLEDEAYRRAHDGVEEPIYYQGVEVGTVRKHSDTLMIFLLKARKPEKYRENIKITLAETDRTIDEAVRAHNLPKPDIFGGQLVQSREM